MSDIIVKYLHLPVPSLNHHLVVQVVEPKETMVGLVETEIKVKISDATSFEAELKASIRNWLMGCRIDKIILIESKGLK